MSCAEDVEKNRRQPSTLLRHVRQLASTEYAKRLDGVAKVIHQKLAEVAEMIEDKVHTISTHQLMYWRMTASGCTGTAA